MFFFISLIFYCNWLLFRSCMHVRATCFEFVSVYTIFRLGFGNASTMWYCFIVFFLFIHIEYRYILYPSHARSAVPTTVVCFVFCFFFVFFSWFFYLFSELRWEVIAFFVDIGEFVDHHCLIFLSIIQHYFILHLFHLNSW